MTTQPPTFPYIDGSARDAPAGPVPLPTHARRRRSDPSAYLMDSRLADAANVALLLGQPLLLTGEPGTGKTQLAHRLAWQLGLDEPLVFHTRSSSNARDLLYRYDTLGRFHAAQTRQRDVKPIDFLRYEALGWAILWSHEPEAVAGLLPPAVKHPGARRSVVLIDEVDKAPRDFPNDLLHEIDELAFAVPEIDAPEVRAHEDRRPVVVLTSNSERNLPDAFLRRCIYHHIPTPDKPRLAEIIAARLPELGQNPDRLIDDALDFFIGVRALGLRKPPSTAELLNWLPALQAHGARPGQRLRDADEALRRSVSTLVKSRDDVDDLSNHVESWLRR